LAVSVGTEEKPQISPLRFAPVEMTILFEYSIPRFQERSAEPQISPLRFAPVEMTILFEYSIPRFQERSAEPQVPPLRYPGFPVDVDGVGGPHAPFLKRKAHTRPCLALRGRKSGFAPVGMTRKG
jgi:hypothetical protein